MQKKEIPSIETNRLRLVSMSVESLRMLIEKNHDAAGEAGGFLVPHGYSMAEKSWIQRRLKMIEMDPQQHPWMYRAIVRKPDNRMVGYISFHHKAPDPDLLAYSDLAVELGYTVEPDYRRKGYAKESAFAMIEWAHRAHGVRTFVLSIGPANLASLKMAESMGFRKIGERLDDIDGLEYTMTAEADDIFKTKKAYHDGALNVADTGFQPPLE